MGETGRSFRTTCEFVQKEVSTILIVCRQLFNPKSAKTWSSVQKRFRNLLHCIVENGTQQQVSSNKSMYLDRNIHIFQIITGLSYYLPESPIYTLLSTLPPPDPTNPTGSTTYDSQDAIHNGFRILEEVLSLSESLEEDTFKREVEKRRMRLGAPSPEQLRRDVFLEISDKSKVRDPR